MTTATTLIQVLRKPPDGLYEGLTRLEASPYPRFGYARLDDEHLTLKFRNESASDSRLVVIRKSTWIGVEVHPRIGAKVVAKPGDTDWNIIWPAVPDPSQAGTTSSDGLRVRTKRNGLYLHVRGRSRMLAPDDRPTAADSERLGRRSEVSTGLDVVYPHAQKIRLICDNLNTHKTGSLYERRSHQKRLAALRSDWRFTTRPSTEVG